MWIVEPRSIRRHLPAVVNGRQTFFRKLALLLLLVGFCSAQSLTPDEAIDRYLAGSRDRQPGCSDQVFAVQIDASLPNLKKQGSMSGLKVVSRTGQTVYRDLRFTGDKFIKTSVIARFLAHDAKPPEAVTTAAPLRLWGDFVKSPSIFVRTFRFVQDYQRIGQCFQPLRLLLTVETRIAGKVEMAVWLNPVDSQSATAADGCGPASPAIARRGQ